MFWKKKGVIFSIDNDSPSLKSHASFPTPLLLEDRIRLYYSSRDVNGISNIYYLDVSKYNPSEIIHKELSPILTPGKLGTFDDSGVQPSCCFIHEGKVYLYYLGWNLGVTVMARNNTGLAISTNNGMQFNRLFEGPVIDRTIHEPYFCYTPDILIENGLWRCWYGSGTGWVKVGDKAEGLFEIKYAYSVDGINWIRPNITSIVPNDKMEVSCRPSLLKEDGIYKMWYSYRKAENFRGGENSYKMGYAESIDGIKWIRKDNEVGISLGENSWDDKMMCFGKVMKIDNKKYLFYNGNGFGFTGIGYAEWCETN